MNKTTIENFTTNGVLMSGFFVGLQMSCSVSMKKIKRKYLPMMTSRAENIKPFIILLYFSTKINQVRGKKVN